mmetsp:Transcript_23260/g.59300  ORF Transcript_23260/g.59300 Transcript_23260/m.59300 type:complete len:106 (+) Transcript_23260:169-486(+)
MAHANPWHFAIDIEAGRGTGGPERVQRRKCKHSDHCRVSGINRATSHIHTRQAEELTTAPSGVEESPATQMPQSSSSSATLVVESVGVDSPAAELLRGPFSESPR